MHEFDWLTVASSTVAREIVKDLRQNPPEVSLTSGQKPSTKIIYIVLQTSVRLLKSFYF